FLGISEARDGQRRNFSPPKPRRRLQTAMAGQDGAGLVDQNWVRPNSLDAAHQPGDLSLGMSPRVSREGLQLPDGKPSDLVVQPPRQLRVGGTAWGRSLRRFDWLLRDRAQADGAAGARRVVAVLHRSAPFSPSGPTERSGPKSTITILRG